MMRLLAVLLACSSAVATALPSKPALRPAPMLHRARQLSDGVARSTVESQNRGVVDPASAQESYLAKSCNPRRLWRLAKSTLRGVLTVVGVRMTTILAIEVVTCAAPVLILSLHSVTTGLIVAKRCSDGCPLSGREQQRLQQQLREMLNYDRRQLNVLTEVVALLLHCMGIPDQKPRRCDTWFSSRWFDPGWFDCMAMLGAMTYSAELYTWVSLLFTDPQSVRNTKFLSLQLLQWRWVTDIIWSVCPATAQKHADRA